MRPDSAGMICTARDERRGQAGWTDEPSPRPGAGNANRWADKYIRLK